MYSLLTVVPSSLANMERLKNKQNKEKILRKSQPNFLHYVKKEVQAKNSFLIKQMWILLYQGKEGMNQCKVANYALILIVLSLFAMFF